MGKTTNFRLVILLAVLAQFGRSAGVRAQDIPLFDPDDKPALEAQAKLIEPSVFVVHQILRVAGERPWQLGTAFLVSKRHRLLATAAHVISRADVDGERLVVTPAGTTSTYRVRRTWYHPGAKRLFDPGLIVNSLDPRDGLLADNSYDVALLQLDDDGPELPGEVRLAAGPFFEGPQMHQVGRFGFPGFLNPPDRPVDLPSVGRIAWGWTRPPAAPPAESDDSLLLGASPIDMGGAPGESGSPIFRQDGAVVGVQQGAYKPDGGEGRAVRIECLRELIAYHGLEALVGGLPGPPPAYFPPPAPLDRPALRRAIVLCYRAEALFVAGRFAASAGLFGEAIELAPTYSLAYAGRGRARHRGIRERSWTATDEEKLRSLELALQDWATVCSLESDRFDAWASWIQIGVELASLNNDYGIYDHVISYAHDMLEIGNKSFVEVISDADRAIVYHGRALACEHLHQRGRALADLDEAIRLSPLVRSYYLSRASHHEDDGRPDLGLVDRALGSLMTADEHQPKR